MTNNRFTKGQTVMVISHPSYSRPDQRGRVVGVGERFVTVDCDGRRVRYNIITGWERRGPNANGGERMIMTLDEYAARRS